MKPEPANQPPLDLAAIRARLASNGQAYWRSLEEVAGTKSFQEFLHREFPVDASVWEDGVSRRHFLKIMGASFALAGLGSCMRMPEEKIVPYVRAPEEMVPGIPLFYATAMTLGGYAIGLLVESHEGRPTKIEGNPLHPASLGATDLFAQASILTLYDPDRSQTVINAGEISTWSVFFGVLSAALTDQTGKRGAGLRILTETISSPTLASQLDTLHARFPDAKWHQYEPLARHNAQAGASLAFGDIVETQYHFDQAEVILSLDADFLTSGPGWVRYARDFIDKRRVGSGQLAMNRLYAVESTPSNTGAMADHCRSMPPGTIEGLARAAAKELGLVEDDGSGLDIRDLSWVKVVMRDLKAHRGTSLILVGDNQPPIVHALAHAMNHALGNTGKTVSYTEPVAVHPVDPFESLQELVSDMEHGKVETLIILGGNPAYNAPADIRFAEAMSKVGLRVHLGLYHDETAQLCHWHIPETHFLETWSDGRAFDGTASIMQPLIAPLYAPAKSAHELLSAIMGHPEQSSHDLVRAYWKAHDLGDEARWHKALHDGVVAGTAFRERKAESGNQRDRKPESEGRRAENGNRRQESQSENRNPKTEPEVLSLRAFAPSRVKPLQDRRAEIGDRKEEVLEIRFAPDPTIWDGRFSNNGWLQELPKPLTKLTWDNAALLSPDTAHRLTIANGDVVELQFRGRTVKAPVWILPGQSDNVVTVSFGYGRTAAGHVGNGAGFNAYSIRPSDAPWFGADVEIRKTGEHQTLACTQDHSSMEGRNLVRSGTLAEFVKNPTFAQEPVDQTTLYPGFKYDGHAWGMAINLTACVGCAACVVACQSENNSPIVGRDQVERGRSMHWLRIDRYFKGPLESPEVYFEPVLCMHCENAPCELVCPVGATVHTEEGLNAMVYNRCIGTRYCSNNCPYKVRRFNFFQYSDLKTPSLKLRQNPQVTVRNRGVMEKCTYCVQRIQAAKITAEKEDRPVRDGEIITACQAACPTQAIVFGDINDPKSRVAKAKAEPLHYGLLMELNTRPRTGYLARLRNPNPEMES